MPRPGSASWPPAGSRSWRTCHLDQAAQVKAAGDQAVYLSDAHSLAIWLTTDKGGNLAKNPGDQATAIAALANPAVRRALNMAIDRKTLVATLLDGYGEPMNSLWVSGDKGFDPSLPAIPFDPAQARQILAQQGYPNGFAVNMDTCTCDDRSIYEAVAAMLANVGVQVTLKPAELDQFNDAWGKGDTNPMRGGPPGLPGRPEHRALPVGLLEGLPQPLRQPRGRCPDQPAGRPADGRLRGRPGGDPAPDRGRWPRRIRRRSSWSARAACTARSARA